MEVLNHSQAMNNLPTRKGEVKRKVSSNSKTNRMRQQSMWHGVVSRNSLSPSFIPPHIVHHAPPHINSTILVQKNLSAIIAKWRIVSILPTSRYHTATFRSVLCLILLSVKTGRCSVAAGNKLIVLWLFQMIMDSSSCDEVNLDKPNTLASVPFL